VSTSRVSSKAYSKHASKRVLLPKLYLNASQGANPAKVAIFKLFVTTAASATVTDPSTEIAVFR
jgi:hypothetical protein